MPHIYCVFLRIEVFNPDSQANILGIVFVILGI